MKTITLLISAILLSWVVYAQHPTGFMNWQYLDPYNPEFAPGELLVKFKDNVNIQASTKKNVVQVGIVSIDRMLSDHQSLGIEKVFAAEQKRINRQFITTYNGQVKELPQLFNIYKLTFDANTDIPLLSSFFSQDPNVDYAEPNYYYYTMMAPPRLTPNDPLYSAQWYLTAVNAPAAWDSTTCDTTQVIGIIDTGVDWDHPDLAENIWTNWDEVPGNGIDDDMNGFVDDIRGWDFVNIDNNPNDDNCHGTHVAGIAAAKGNNETGIAGVAWNARIMPIKVLQSSGYGTADHVAAGVNYARNNGATVINLSLGSYGESLTLKSALEVAYNTAFIVAAAGNDAMCICYDSIICANMYPAAYSWVMGVMASSSSGKLAEFSNIDKSGPVVSTHPEGYNYEITAPGVSIFSTFPNGGYHYLNGTSMASPIVAGAVALIKSQHPEFTNEQIFMRLIQGASGNILNIANSMNMPEPPPDFYYINKTIIDTLPGCDNDGVVDAGETIRIWISIKNAGGYADSVWCKMRLGPFEDTAVATVTDSTGFIGDISSYATLNNQSDPFEVYIRPNVVHKRQIFFQFLIGAINSSDTLTESVIIEVFNGEEISGNISDTLTLTPDKLWIITGSFRLTPSGVLQILPGTSIDIISKIVNDGKIIAHGTEDSIINISGSAIVSGSYRGLLDMSYVDFKMTCIDGWSANIGNQDGNISHSRFNLTSGWEGCINGCEIDFSHCFFFNSTCLNRFDVGCSCQFSNCVFDNISVSINGNNPPMFGVVGTKVEKSVLSRFTFLSSNAVFCKSSILDRYSDIAYKAIPGYYDTVQNQYWGTADSIYISEKIYDFFDDATLCEVIYSPYLTAPSDSCHGLVWKVEINGTDPQDEHLDPLGVGCARFDVYFNKAMDTQHNPFLTFGVREPFTQHLVADSISWSADSSIWTAWYNIGLETGDGINTIRVSDARDTANWEIPVEVERFQFVIQAAGSASIEFIATPGIGKVDLEWPPAGTEDILGYNLYRFYKINDITFSDTLRINTSLITDTLFTDYNVIPDTTYYYLYKIVGTDLAESDYSKTVQATPFSAANGDANGDMAVNVLDITTIVAYMLNQNPQPFLFDAADVNYDDQIDVLDIIGVVQILTGGKTASKNYLYTQTKPAYIYFNEQYIQLQSEGQVAAFQFELLGENLDDIVLFLNLEGYEFAYVKQENRIFGIIYSFVPRQIPGGFRDIIRMDYSGNDLRFGEVVGGDINGNYVPILKGGEIIAVPRQFRMIVYPNPFSGITHISYQLHEPAFIEVNIYAMNGQIIRTLVQEQQQAGTYEMVWDGKINDNKALASGIYFCRLEAAPVDKKGEFIRQNRKMILIK